jgi:hypothetical protein
MIARAILGLLIVSCLPALAAEPIALPFSKLPAFPAPALKLDGLSPEVAANVTRALSDAANGNRMSREAEAAIRTAEETAAKARKAAEGAKPMDVSFAGGACRYRGEIARGRAEGLGVMTCGATNYTGAFRDNAPDGAIRVETAETVFSGTYRDGKANGLGGDTAKHQGDAYQGEYKDGARSGFGVERDKDGVYPGRFGIYADPKDKSHRITMALSGRQDFPAAHWAGSFGAYLGPKIACTIIKGAYLEGSVLDGYGAKFDAAGKPVEQGLYTTGLLKGARTPPC